MANIKFSQFTVGNTESDIDFVVGYKGANNIQISPANLLSATLAGYLPLTGGTMSGNIVFTDNVQAQFGTGNDLRLVHNGSDSYIQQTGFGDLIIQQTVDDADISFQCDNGAGGISAYITLDGSNVRTQIDREMRFMDTIPAKFGTSGDLQIQHSSTDSFIENNTGNLFISNFANDKDIRFATDDGSGGTTTYFFLDGSRADGTYLYTEFPDNSIIGLGNDTDLQIYHNGTNSIIDNYTGDLAFQQKADDKDIVFKCDDGSGGVTEYFRLDGSTTSMQASKNIVFADDIRSTFGGGADMAIYHNSASQNGIIENFTNDLIIQNNANDEDIVFKCDDGSGGVAEYFRVDGSSEKVFFSKPLLFFDGVSAQFGTGSDLLIYHDGSEGTISNATGNLRIIQSQDDGDMQFFSDDGSGGTTEYFRLDGALEKMVSSKNIMWLDNVKAQFGDSNDLQIYHDSANSTIDNSSGHLFIKNSKIDRDIIFQADDGTGVATTTYFKLDGGDEIVVASKEFRFTDNVPIKLGTGPDFQMLHNGTTTSFENSTGNLLITNFANDADIILKSDNGSGGTADYLIIDGSEVSIRMKRKTKWDDNIEATFGNSEDLVIKHNGTNNVIQSITGDLKVGVANTFAVQNDTFNENMITAAENGEVSLYHNNVKKLDTRTTGIRITGVSEYADNTAAIAGGLTTGDVYRTGDLLKIVH